MAKKLTKEQIRKALRRLNNGWPDDVWIFVGDGTLCLMEKGEDGHEQTSTGCVDPDYIVESFPKIDADSGGW